MFKFLKKTCPLTIRKLYLLLTTFGICFIFAYYIPLSRFKIDEFDGDLRYFNPNGMKYIINTSFCLVPGINPWDSDYIPFIRKLNEHRFCKPWEKTYDWTYAEKNELVLNTTKMKADGFSFSEGSCCYRIISRITQHVSNYTWGADVDRRISDCISITKERTKILEEFIMVECFWMKLINAVATRTYHTFAQSEKSIKVRNKIKSRNKRKETNKPPNILIVGLDSTSRINFRRNMFETHRTLESLGAVEMLGYVKAGAGSNTFTNFVAILTGYPEEDFAKICYFSSGTKMDDCPFIWKRFDAANYLTAHLEDAPQMAIFNYLKVGFVKQPVDFYPRPLFWTSKSNPVKLFWTRKTYCIGSRTSDEVLINYTEQLQAMAAEKETPIFTISWATDVSHESLDGTQMTDLYYANFLQRLNATGYLDNTILFFMGDHGYKYGSVRQTPSGYYEDKFPNMWIRLPPRIQTMYPEWQKALKINSRRLTSPFALYWTLNLILDRFTTTSSLLDTADDSTKEIIPRKYKHNFLEPVREENTCADIGISEAYCPCYLRESLNKTDPLLQKLAKAATLKINSMLINATLCASIHVSNITWGVVEDKTQLQKIKIYTATFKTVPGDFVIEAKAEFSHKTNQVGFINETVAFQRVSKINQKHILCIKDHPMRSKLELYCFCTSKS